MYIVIVDDFEENSIPFPAPPLSSEEPKALAERQIVPGAIALPAVTYSCGKTETEDDDETNMIPFPAPPTFLTTEQEKNLPKRKEVLSEISLAPITYSCGMEAEADEDQHQVATKCKIYKKY